MTISVFFNTYAASLHSFVHSSTEYVATFVVMKQLQRAKNYHPYTTKSQIAVKYIQTETSLCIQSYKMLVNKSGARMNL